MLQYFAANAQANVERVRIGYFISAYQVWPHWPECIECFANHPLRSDRLKIARADVVEDGVSEDVPLPIVGGDVPATGSDDEHKFRFVVRLARNLRQDDGLIRPDHHIRKLREDGGHLGNLLPGFGGVVAIIEADANQLRRTWNRRK